MDYGSYRMSRREKIRCLTEAGLLNGGVALCFYDSWWPFLAFPLLAYLYLREKKKELGRRRRERLKLQFRDAVQALAAALAAGYSAENAVREARKDLQLMYEESLDMVQELAAVQRKLDANQTLESAFWNFAQRSGLEEAETFAEVFAVGKRSGGDLIEIMKNTSRTISETVDTQRQVEGVLASRRLEQRIMSLMPFGILLYLRLGSPGFLEPFYHNLAGVCVASLCLCLYAFAVWLGQWFLKIEV